MDSIQTEIFGIHRCAKISNRDIFPRVCLRGGTDWSDDSAGIVRARLRMKKPELNATETGNVTESKESKTDADED